MTKPTEVVFVDTEPPDLTGYTVGMTVYVNQEFVQVIVDNEAVFKCTPDWDPVDPASWAAFLADILLAVAKDTWPEPAVEPTVEAVPDPLGLDGLTPAACSFVTDVLLGLNQVIVPDLNVKLLKAPILPVSSKDKRYKM